MAGEMKGRDGTAKSGYVTQQENPGPRECSACIWMGMGTCGNQDVLEDPELAQLHDKDGRVRVEPDSCCNYYQSRKSAIVYAVRHGETEGNRLKKFRGWIDVPLNAQGKKDGQAAREYLSDKGIKRVFCADLTRHEQMAKLVLPSKKAERDPLLRPWDVGVFAGKERSETQDEFNYYIDNPEVPIPDGESLKEFSKRTGKTLARYIKEGQEDGPILLVISSSTAIQTEKYVEGKDELGRPEDVDRVLPGGIMVILDEEKAGLKVEVVFGDSPEQDADYGS